MPREKVTFLSPSTPLNDEFAILSLRDLSMVEVASFQAAETALLSLLKSTGGTYLGPRKSAKTGEAAHNEITTRLRNE